MGLDDSVFDACFDLADGIGDADEIKNSLVDDIISYSVIYLTDNWEAIEKYYYNKIKKRLFSLTYDILWLNYEELPLDNGRELYKIISHRAFDLMEKIQDYLKVNLLFDLLLLFSL